MDENKCFLNYMNFLLQAYENTYVFIHTQTRKTLISKDILLKFVHSIKIEKSCSLISVFKKKNEKSFINNSVKNFFFYLLKLYRSIICSYISRYYTA